MTDNLAVQAGDLEMSRPTTGNRKGRRRLLTWIAFGLFGLITGVIWAVGIATSSATVDVAGAAAAPQVFGTASGAAPASVYVGLVAEDTALTIDFIGSWGVVDADTAMFDVDLSAQSGTFFTEVYLTNNPTGWAALQLEFRQVNKACTDPTLAAADWASPDAASVMVIESEDAYAIFGSLAGGGNFCLGIQAISKANDQNGTFIRRPSGGSPVAPAFAAVLNRSA